MPRGRALLLLAGAAAIAAFAAAVVRAQRLPEGPQPVAWDREPCAHCHMHVGDPRFAAQLHTASGEVLTFDDPGCLLAFQAERRPEVHAVWFRHVREDRWIPGDRVAFVKVPESPMGHGLGATDAGDPGAMPYERAAAVAAGREP